MHEALQPAFELKNLVRVRDGAGEDFDEPGKPFAGHGADTLTKRADKSTARTKTLRRRPKRKRGAEFRKTILIILPGLLHGNQNQPMFSLSV
jgi:hypothetical protein